MSILLLRAAAPPICSNLYLGGLHWRPTDVHSHTVGRVWGACRESAWLEGYSYSALPFSGHPSTFTFGANVVSRVLLTTWQQDDELTCLLGVTKVLSFAWQQGEARPVWTDECCLDWSKPRGQWDWSDCRRPVCVLHPNWFGNCFCRCCVVLHARQIQVCFAGRHGRVFPSKKARTQVCSPIFAQFDEI